RRATMASVVTGTVAAVLLIVNGLQFAAIVFGWAVFSNVSTLRAPARVEKARGLDGDIGKVLISLSQQDDSAPAEARRVAAALSGQRQPAFKLAAVETAAVAGQGTAARELLENLPGAVPPAMYALVVASETFGQRGVEDLEEIFRRAPDRWHARWLAFTLHLAGRLPDMVDELNEVPASQRTPEAVEAAAGIADWAGDTDVAARLRSIPVG
ncbi:MAG: hypothetical protein ACC660_07535, partial [Acidimicrobiales bacterium]